MFCNVSTVTGFRMDKRLKKCIAEMGSGIGTWMTIALVGNACVTNLRGGGGSRSGPHEE